MLRPRQELQRADDYTSQEREAIEHERELPPGDFAFGVMANGYAAVDGYEISVEDFEHMYGPQEPGPEATDKQYGDYLVQQLRWQRERHPQPCGLCGGRLRHNPECIALSDEWAPVMPWGRYKGQPVRGVHKNYLRKLVAVGLIGRLPVEVASEIENVLATM